MCVWWGEEWPNLLREKEAYLRIGRQANKMSTVLQVDIRRWYFMCVRAQSPDGKKFSPCMCVEKDLVLAFVLRAVFHGCKKAVPMCLKGPYFHVIRGQGP